jgi:hypothetical protein
MAFQNRYIGIVSGQRPRGGKSGVPASNDGNIR